MRYLGIDYGKKRIGLALGEQGLTSPLLVYFKDKNIFSKIEKICLEEKIDKIILGFSQDLEQEIKNFKKQLTKRLEIPIILQDESLTTREAADTMLVSLARRKSRREKVDAVAAAQILAAYFDSDKKEVGN